MGVFDEEVENKMTEQENDGDVVDKTNTLDEDDVSPGDGGLSQK